MLGLVPVLGATGDPKSPRHLVNTIHLHNPSCKGKMYPWGYVLYDSPPIRCWFALPVCHSGAEDMGPQGSGPLTAMQCLSWRLVSVLTTTGAISERVYAAKREASPRSPPHLQSASSVMALQTGMGNASQPLP